MSGKSSPPSTAVEVRRRQAHRLRKKKVSTSWGPDEYAYLESESRRLGYSALATYIRDKVLDVPQEGEEIVEDE